MQSYPKKQPKVKRKRNPAKIVGWAILCIGAALLAAAILYASQIPAFVGLGLIFWGFILTLIQTEEYVKETVMNATALSSLKTLNQILQELNYEGKAIFLPPKYLQDPEENKAYIPKLENWELPKPEQIYGQQESIFIKNPEGILISPPGSELTRLFEKTLETSFTRINLEYLRQNMPKLLIEDLEIAQNFELEEADGKIYARIENSIYRSLIKDLEKMSSIWGKIGCPLSSAIACALTKATGKPVTIEAQKISKDGRTIEIEYRLIEENGAGK